MGALFEETLRFQRDWEPVFSIPNRDFDVYMDVSENSGTTKSSILIGFSIFFGNIHMGLIIKGPSIPRVLRDFPYDSLKSLASGFNVWLLVKI